MIAFPLILPIALMPIKGKVDKELIELMERNVEATKKMVEQLEIKFNKENINNETIIRRS